MRGNPIALPPKEIDFACVTYPHVFTLPAIVISNLHYGSRTLPHLELSGVKWGLGYLSRSQQPT